MTVLVTRQHRSGGGHHGLPGRDRRRSGQLGSWPHSQRKKAGLQSGHGWAVRHSRSARPQGGESLWSLSAGGPGRGRGRALERFPQIIARLAGMCQRFCTALDCVDIGFLPDGTLDQLPLPAQLGASRVGGIDVNKPRIRAALAAVLALAPSPDRVHRGRHDRQSPCHDRADPRHLQHPPGRLRSAQTPRQAARRQTRAHPPLLSARPGRPDRIGAAHLQDHVIAPILAGAKIRRHNHVPARLTPIDQDYEHLRPTWPPCSATWASSPAQPRRNPLAKPKLLEIMEPQAARSGFGDEQGAEASRTAAPLLSRQGCAPRWRDFPVPAGSGRAGEECPERRLAEPHPAV